MALNNDALVMVFSRNAFYRRLHFLALGAFVVSLLIIASLICILSYLLTNPSKSLYFAADDVGRLIQIIPVNTPNMNTDEVLAWANEAVMASFSYDFINYRSQLQNAEKYYTEYGWSKYMNTLSLSGNLRALRYRRQIVSAQVVEPPTILTQGLLSGAFAWKIRMLLLVTYSMPPYDGSNQFSNSLTVETIIQRQPILSSYKGMGILQLIANLSSDTVQPSTTMTETSGGT